MRTAPLVGLLILGLVGALPTQASDCSPKDAAEQTRQAYINNAVRAIDNTFETPGNLAEQACLSALMNMGAGLFITIPGYEQIVTQIVTQVVSQSCTAVQSAANSAKCSINVNAAMPGVNFDGSLPSCNYNTTVGTPTAGGSTVSGGGTAGSSTSGSGVNVNNAPVGVITRIKDVLTDLFR